MLRAACSKRLRMRLRLSACMVLLMCAGWMIYAKSGGHGPKPFGLAEDCPRGALVYAQFADLPALVKQWDESELKQHYLESTNFKQFQHRHLARKLVARWQEFNQALGFDLDMATVQDSADNKVAIAVYDIGRLEMVFIAPLSEEKLAATMFFQKKDGFEETELPDGTTFYSREVEADRGRQKQEICFATLRGRIIFATSERLLLRTLANINGKSKKDRLSDDASFAALSREVTPHFATVWVDQSKLNSDWYFKHYWMMSDVEQLSQMRAGMFDLEMQEGKWIEHRDFLSQGKGPESDSIIPVQDAKRLSALVPADAPYFALHAVGHDEETAAALIRDTLFDRPPEKADESSKHWSWRSYDTSEFYEDRGEDNQWWSESLYTYLGQNYNKMIDDPVDAKITDNETLDDAPLRDEAESLSESSLQKVLQPAGPIYLARAESPRTFDGPLFAEFRRVGILTLRSPRSLDQQSFERVLSGLAQNRLMITGSNVNLKWTDKGETGQRWRELELPMLGWKLCYALNGRELIVASDAELLRATLNAGAMSSTNLNLSSPIDELTVIRLDQREQSFDKVVAKLDEANIKAYWKERPKSDENEESAASQEFFSGNIASLLDVASRVRQIEIKRKSSPGRLHEDVEMSLK